MRQSCGQIFRYAVATGRAKRDPSADLKGALKANGKPKHHRALPKTELPEMRSRPMTAIPRRSLRCAS
jgi:hypothetical protein